MRLIDADALPKYTGYALSADEVAMGVENSPTIDAVPVVRCGDCLFCQMELGEGADEPWCDVHSTTVDIEMFCSWGIRRNNEIDRR